jgi:hypothetical protein
MRKAQREPPPKRRGQGPLADKAIAELIEAGKLRERSKELREEMEAITEEIRDRRAPGASRE